ncbi:hypothetical protein C8Q74DRAFT_107333 [Fomes fomentarius]|nr:hypothetical protein C8Q74DRAFT_107333 [Fomes fomentarius]
MLRRHYPGGILHFGHCVAQFDTFDARTRTNVHLVSTMPASEGESERHAGEAITPEWLPDATYHLYSIVRGPLRCRCRIGEHSVMDPGPGLYQCSTCAKQSALVRKCSRCHSAWYCDAACQRAHWQEHKKKCRSS